MTVLRDSALKGDSLVAQMVKNPPALQETQVQPLGQEDPLEKGMATHSDILAGNKVLRGCAFNKRELVRFPPQD